jgi:hypothetical protein
MSFERFTEKSILVDFNPITLSEMNEVQLMNRTDTKFVLGRDVFDNILPLLASKYRVLEVEGTRMSSYSTQYFDTPEFKFFNDHHNGRSSRYKVRIRNYVESKLFFLEVKHKFKGRTNKKRIKVASFEPVLSEESVTYIDKVIGQSFDLKTVLWNSFDRVTLVNTEDKERLTLDMNLAFKHNDKEQSYDFIVVAELKQENADRKSLFYSLMKENNVRPNSFSKYCVGVMAFNDLKSNNFKTQKLLIDKLRRNAG